jgi:hypothetical protein
VSDIDTIVVDGLKALDPEWPIREVDTIELHIPSRGLVHHANILWRAVDEIGVGFMKDTTLPVRYFDGDGVIRRRQSGKQ